MREPNSSSSRRAVTVETPLAAASAEVVDGDQRAPDCLPREWPIEERCALDEEVSPRRAATDALGLLPEAPGHDREVQVAHRLALDHGAVADCVVPCAKLFDAHLDSERHHASGTPDRRSNTSTSTCTGTT